MEMDKVFNPDEVLPGGTYYGKKEDGSIDRSNVLGWRPWKKEDLDANDVVSFVPAYLPALFKPGIEGPMGEKYIYLDVNNLGCWLQVAHLNTVNRFFYNAYKNLEDQIGALEHFKRNGPDNAPWGSKFPDGRRNWHFQPEAYTFGIDLDGRYLVGREIKGLESRLYRFFMDNKFMVKHFNMKKRRQLMCRVAMWKMRPLLFLIDRKNEINQTKRNLKQRWQAFKKEWFN